MGISIAKSISWVIEKLGGLVDIYNKVSSSFGGKTIDFNFDKDTAIDKINNIRNTALAAVDQTYDNKTKKHIEPIDLEKFNANADKLGENIKNFKFSQLFSSLQNKINGALDIGNNTTSKLSNGGKDAIPVKADGGKLDTVGEVNVSDEDLKYMKDFAEQEWINKFTTATLAPNVSISFGDIHETADAEKLKGRIEQILKEEISEVAEGVYD